MVFEHISISFSKFWKKIFSTRRVPDGPFLENVEKPLVFEWFFNDFFQDRLHFFGVPKNRISSIWIFKILSAHVLQNPWKTNGFSTIM